MMRGLLQYRYHLFFLLFLFDGSQSQQSTPFRKVGNNNNTNNNNPAARLAGATQCGLYTQHIKTPSGIY
jgi:hypothetical protein